VGAHPAVGVFPGEVHARLDVHAASARKLVARASSGNSVTEQAEKKSAKSAVGAGETWQQLNC